MQMSQQNIKNVVQ